MHGIWLYSREHASFVMVELYLLFGKGRKREFYPGFRNLKQIACSLFMCVLDFPIKLALENSKINFAFFQLILDRNYVLS